MHLWRPLIVMGLFAAVAGRAAVVYKWTDAAGVVHYSDQPSEGAEKIVTASGSSAAPPGGAPTSNAPSAKKALSGVQFTRFAVTSPAPDEVFFGDEVINVSLVAEPPLKPGQSVSWHLNGKQVDQAPDALRFTMQSLERGTYAIAATVLDMATGESQSTDSVTFYVRQPSELSPQHQHH